MRGIFLPQDVSAERNSLRDVIFFCGITYTNAGSLRLKSDIYDFIGHFPNCQVDSIGGWLGSHLSPHSRNIPRAKKAFFGCLCCLGTDAICIPEFKARDHPHFLPHPLRGTVLYLCALGYFLALLITLAPPPPFFLCFTGFLLQVRDCDGRILSRSSYNVKENQTF